MALEPQAAAFVRAVWIAVLTLNVLGVVLLVRTWHLFGTRGEGTGELRRPGTGSVLSGVLPGSRQLVEGGAGRLVAALGVELPWCQVVAADERQVEFVNRYLIGRGQRPWIQVPLFSRGTLRPQEGPGGAATVDYSLDYSRFAATMRRMSLIVVLLMVAPNAVGIVPLDLYLRFWQPEWRGHANVYHLFHVVWLPFLGHFLYRLNLRAGRRAVRRAVEMAAGRRPDAG